MKQFEIGKHYYMRSSCDHECIWKYEVVARTAKQVTLKEASGNEIKCRINDKIDPWNEVVFPLGRYSMAPFLRAERECKTYAVVRVYDEHKRVIHQELCTCSIEQAKKKAAADCEWLGGKSWEVSTLIQPF